MENDTLDAWLRVRPSLTAATVASSPSSPTHASTTALTALSRHVDRRLRPRDPIRAARFDDAVALLRERVSAPPDTAGLANLAARLHGTPAPPPLRTATAYAHGGRAIMRPFAPEAFEAAVDGADVDDDGPAWFRAARLYADICFFHPFDDGNARLALCALVWVLHRGDVGVVDVGPVVMPWVPSSAPGLLRVVRAIGRPGGATHHHRR